MKSLWEKLTLLTTSIIDTAISGNGKIRQSVLKEEVGSLISCKTETPVQIKKKGWIILEMLLFWKGNSFNLELQKFKMVHMGIVFSWI